MASAAPQRPHAPDTQELLQLLLDQGEEYALFLMTPDGTVTDWFPGAEHVFGFAAHEMVGRSATQLFNEEDRHRGAEKHEFEVALSAGRAEDDRWHVRKDGTRFWGSGVLFALRDEANRPVGFAKMVRNRTDLKAYTEALENQVKALARVHEQKDLFLAVLGHELRTPLAALMNAMEIIRRSNQVEPMVHSAVQIIERQTAVIQRLTDDLMDTTRLRAGKVELELQLLDLKDVFHALRQAPGRSRRRAGRIFARSPSRDRFRINTSAPAS